MEDAVRVSLVAGPAGVAVAASAGTGTGSGTRGTRHPAAHHAVAHELLGLGPLLVLNLVLGVVDHIEHRVRHWVPPLGYDLRKVFVQISITFCKLDTCKRKRRG